MPAEEMYCRVCERTVYLGKEETAVCPVCGTPLIAADDPAVAR